MAKTTMQPGTLEVDLEYASGLRVSLYRQGWQPTFNEQLRFRMNGSTPEIAVTVFNERTYNQDEELGSIRIPLANLFRDACPAKIPSTVYTLKCPASGQHQGDLRLSLAYTPISVEDGSHCQSSEPLPASKLEGNGWTNSYQILNSTNV